MGTIKFESKVGVGTTFEFTFKLSEEEDIDDNRDSELNDVVSANSMDLEFRFIPMKFPKIDELDLQDRLNEQENGIKYVSDINLSRNARRMTEEIVLT